MTDRPAPGAAQSLLAGLRCVLAPNPSPMTFWGTNTYLVGTGDVAVIDPGPDDPGHLEAVLSALNTGERVSHILVTHTHLDHSPGARALSARTGAPVLAFGPAEAGRSPRMQALAARGGLDGGEGLDAGFRPDRTLADGDWVEGAGWRLQALWTPGHIGNHLCFLWPGAQVLFSGDLVMGWATSMVSPPDGDLNAFLASLDRLDSLDPVRTYAPGHGPLVDRPAACVDELRRHRLMRSEQILAALGDAPGTPAELTARIYTEVDRALLPAAARNVLAHLIALEEQGHVCFEGPIGPRTTARLKN